MNKKFAVNNGVCECCGRELPEIKVGDCPSDDCPSNMEDKALYLHMASTTKAIRRIAQATITAYNLDCTVDEYLARVHA